MWSRLAEGIADIVAPEENEQEHEGDEQLYSCSAVVVASPPPSHPSVTATGTGTDEQEQYICELERALLQRKKQNEALETKVLKLETEAKEVQQLKNLLKAQEVEITQQKAIIDSLPVARPNVMALEKAKRSDLEADSDRLVQKLQQTQAEAAALATRCQAQEEELSGLRARVDELEAAKETLRDDEREARSRAAEYEQGYMNLLAEIEKLKTANETEKMLLMVTREKHASSMDRQKLYDLEARLTTSEADKVVAQKDAERLQQNLDALEGVLHHFQVDNKAQKDSVARMEAELEQVKKELQLRQACSEPTEGEAMDIQQVLEALAQKTLECDHLREALESSAMQYNSERDVLDKSLAAQLVVAYVDSTKKGEILHLMARMMDFTEEQKRRVGLTCPIHGNGGGGLFSSIIGLVAPEESGKPPVDASTIEGKSFAEMWSQFLLDEATTGK